MSVRSSARRAIDNVEKLALLRTVGAQEGRGVSILVFVGLCLSKHVAQQKVDLFQYKDWTIYGRADNVLIK